MIVRDPAAPGPTDRHLQTLLELGDEKSTIVSPLPIDLLQPFSGASGPDQPVTAAEPCLAAYADALRRHLNGSHAGEQP